MKTNTPPIGARARQEITKAFSSPAAAREQLARYEEFLEGFDGWQPYRPGPLDLAGGRARIREFWATRGGLPRPSARADARRRARAERVRARVADLEVAR